MKGFGFASIVASGLAAAVLGLAAPPRLAWATTPGSIRSARAWRSPRSIPACSRAA